MDFITFFQPLRRCSSLDLEIFKCCRLHSLEGKTWLSDWFLIDLMMDIYLLSVLNILKQTARYWRSTASRGLSSCLVHLSLVWHSCLVPTSGTPVLYSCLRLLVLLSRNSDLILLSWTSVWYFCSLLLSGTPGIPVCYSCLTCRVHLSGTSDWYTCLVLMFSTFVWYIVLLCTLVRYSYLLYSILIPTSDNFRCYSGLVLLSGTIFSWFCLVLLSVPFFPRTLG